MSEFIERRARGAPEASPLRLAATEGRLISTEARCGAGLYSVILFDEVFKAHRIVQRWLLQVL